MRLPQSKQTACCVIRIDQEQINRNVLGKSQGTDYYLLLEWAGGWVRACVRLCACACRVGRGRDCGWENIARSQNQSEHRIVKYRPFTNWKIKEKLMVSYYPAEQPALLAVYDFFSLCRPKSQNASNAGYRLREDTYGEIFRPWT